MIVEVSVGLKDVCDSRSLKEICDSRRVCPKIIYMSSLSEGKSGNTSSLDECS